MAELQGPARIDKAKGMRERRLAGSLAMNQFQKSLSENATRVSKDREELQKMKRQAFDSNDQAERIANLKKTGGKSIDKQILEQITERGRELAQSHISAYGPDGNAEMIAEYNIDKAKINKDLDDLTMFVGTLDAELEARDKAIDDDTMIFETDESGKRIGPVEDEQFKNGIFNGESDVEITYDKDGGYSINPTAQHVANMTTGATPPNINPINLGVYAENLRKNGTSYKAISPNATSAMTAAGSGLIDGFKGQNIVEFSNIDGEMDNPNFDSTKAPDPKTNPQKVPVKKGYKTQDLDAMKTALTGALTSTKGFDFGLKNSKGQPIKLPPPNQMWAELQKQGYLEDEILDYDTGNTQTVNGVTKPIMSRPVPTVSWDQYKNPDKEKKLKEIYAQYLINTQFPTTDPDKKIITTDQKVKQGTSTGKYNN